MAEKRFFYGWKKVQENGPGEQEDGQRQREQNAKGSVFDEGGYVWAFHDFVSVCILKKMSVGLSAGWSIPTHTLCGEKGKRMLIRIQPGCVLTVWRRRERRLLA